ncbi:chaperonin-containing T-complex member BBS12 [Pholidichthys leucotaenia]
MLGTSILNQRRHVGLQKLSALAAVSHSTLGPNKKFKFLQDDSTGESGLVCTCFRILESLELTCAVGQLVYEILQAHHRVHHTGSGCLLFLAGAWSQVALDCLQKGVSVTHLISALSEGLDVCVDVFRKCSISTEGLLVQCVRDSSNMEERRKIKLSRHFCESESLDIEHIAAGLSHSCEDAMKLVVDAVRMQQDTGCCQFDVTKMLACVLPGLPEERACVVHGYVVLLPSEQASVAHHLNDQQLRVAVINGDLSHTYRHLGFRRPAGVQRVSDELELSRPSEEDEWVERVLKLLLKLEVNLMLVSGHASERMMELCCRHRILIVEKIKVSVLKTMANSLGVVLVTYATQLSKHSVGSGVTVHIWGDVIGPKTAVNISTSAMSGLVTAIITSTVHGKLQVLEDRFWACAYRLHHTLTDGAVLPGAGATELLCVHHLKNHVENSSHVRGTKASVVNLYRSDVLDLMADSLINYISTLMVNSGNFSKVRARTLVSQQLLNHNSNPGNIAELSRLFCEAVKEGSEEKGQAAATVYDNLSVKQEAWRRALDLVFLVLQTDAEVITGMEQKTEVTQERLML